MGDAFRKVQSGEPLTIAARAWSALMEVAHSAARERLPLSVEAQRAHRQTCVCLAVNKTGADRRAFEPMGIAGWHRGDLFDTAGTDKTIGFRDPVIVGRTPTVTTDYPTTIDDSDTFCVTLEPIPFRGIGRVAISGPCLVRLNANPPNDPRFSGGNRITIKSGDATGCYTSHHGHRNLGQLLSVQAPENPAINLQMVLLGTYQKQGIAGVELSANVARGGSNSNAEVIRGGNGQSTLPVTEPSFLKSGQTIASGTTCIVAEIGNGWWILTADCAGIS